MISNQTIICNFTRIVYNNRIKADKLSVEGIAYDEFLQLDVFCDKLFSWGNYKCFFRGIINGYEKTTVVKKTAATAAKKAVKSVASKVTEAAVAATAAKATKAAATKVTKKVAAGRVNVSDKSAVEQDILKGEPTDASSKMQFGDIERMLFMA